MKKLMIYKSMSLKSNVIPSINCQFRQFASKASPKKTGLAELKAANEARKKKQDNCANLKGGATCSDKKMGTICLDNPKTYEFEPIPVYKYNCKKRKPDEVLTSCRFEKPVLDPCYNCRPLDEEAELRARGPKSSCRKICKLN